MHTDKKLLCNRFFLNQQLEEDKKRERQSRSWSVYYLTLNIARSAASLTIGYLRLASVEIIRRWASRPATNAISVVHLSQLTDQYTPSSSDLGFISLCLDYRNTRDMRSDPQGLLHSRTPRIVISARISFFHKSKPQKKEIPIQSELLKTTSMHIFTIVIKGAIAGGKKERLIAAPRENVWRWITDNDDDERYYPVCLRFTLYVSEEETRNPNLCVCLCSEVTLLTTKNLFVDFGWMKKRTSSWKNWGSSINVWQSCFLCTKPKNLKGLWQNGLSKFWLVF